MLLLVLIVSTSINCKKIFFSNIFELLRGRFLYYNRKEIAIMTMKGIFGLEVGKIYINSLGHKIEVLGIHEKLITYSINNTTYWGTDYDRFFDIISR